MKSLLKKYSDTNPEKFNKEFILSRKEHNILEYVQDIFNSLEILNEIKVEEVTIDTNEANFGPIKSQHHYYKSILPSRLNKIHYKIRITPSESSENELTEIIDDAEENRESIPISKESFIKEGDIFINKLVDDCFYINEGIRYFLIYQIVDNATYGTEDAVSLKSLLMPVTVKQKNALLIPEFEKEPMEARSFVLPLFSKAVSPLLYIFGKEAYNSIVKFIKENKDSEDIYELVYNYKDSSLKEKVNKFLGTNFKFAEKDEDLVEDGRTVFKIVDEKSKSSPSCFISVPKKDLDIPYQKNMLACFLNIRNEAKKKKIAFSIDNLDSPWFWVDTLTAIFTNNSDPAKKLYKLRTLLLSLNRLIDSSSRKILTIPAEDKATTLTIIRYIMRNFNELLTADSQDLDNKRLRLYEYQLYPLRAYFSSQIYRVLNSPTRSKAILERIFSNLSPMSIIKQTVTSELLRYYNATNDLNLYSAFLKYTFRGPQSLNKTVTIEQRNLHPSYTGRLSLIAASASDPGMSGTLSPFVEVFNGSYFSPQKDI